MCLGLEHDLCKLILMVVACIAGACRFQRHVETCVARCSSWSAVLVVVDMCHAVHLKRLALLWIQAWLYSVLVWTGRNLASGRAPVYACNACVRIANTANDVKAGRQKACWYAMTCVEVANLNDSPNLT